MVQHRLPQQHAVCHVFQYCPFGRQILKSDCITHLLAQLHVQLLTHPLGHRHCGNSSRLRASNAFPLAGISPLNQKLRNLGGFARPGLPNQNDNLVLIDQLQQFIFGLECGQLDPGFQQFVVVLGILLTCEVVDIAFCLFLGLLLLALFVDHYFPLHLRLLFYYKMLYLLCYIQ